MRLRPRRSPVAVDPGRIGIAAFASRHAPGWSMPSGSEPWHKLLLVLSGGARLERSGATEELREDHLVLIPAGMQHRLMDPPDGAAVVAGLCLDAHRLAGACGGAWPELARRLSTGVDLDPAGRELVMRLVGRILAGGPGDPASFEATAWSEALAIIAQAVPRPEPRRSRSAAGTAAALVWLDEHIAQPISVGELAARAGSSYRAFTGQVRRSTGESVLGRILRLRLQRADALLRSGMPVAAAALSSGFGDLSGFYRHYRRRFGVSPGARRSGRMAQPGR